MGNVKVADDYKDRLFRMIFVDKVRKYSQEQTLEDAVEQTIRECMEEDVMADFLGIDAEMIEEIMNDGLIKASQK